MNGSRPGLWIPVLLPGLLLVACGLGSPTAGDGGRGQGAHTLEPIPPLRRVQVVEIAVPEALPDFRWSRETAGLVLLSLESGLADLADTVPRVGSTPPSPGLSDALQVGARVWTARVGLGADPDDLEISLSLCDPHGDCEQHVARATREAPRSATASLLQAAAAQVGERLAEGAHHRWADPLSEDRYAVLMAGRAAATLYGLYPPVAPELRGDSREDPVARAVFIDPTMAPAWWVVGRRDAAQGDLEAAAEAFGRAVQSWPDKPLFLADLARALVAEGAWARAEHRVEELARATPWDPRFHGPELRLALARGRTAEVRNALVPLEERHPGDPLLLEMRALLARKEGDRSAELQHLATWQAAAPLDPEPVIRQVELLVRTRRLPKARALLPELTRRGHPDLANRYLVALALDLSEPDQAREAAEALASPAVERDVAVRLALAEDPEEVPAPLRDRDDHEASLIRAAVALRHGDPAAARQEIVPVLEARPWWAPALALGARAFRATDDPEAARRALDRLGWVDPLGLHPRELDWHTSFTAAARQEGG